MASENWIRKYELTIGEPNTTNGGVVITESQIEFRINKTADEKLNEIDLKIYNLSAETIAVFDKKDVFVELKVAYSDNPLVTVFAGEKTHMSTKREDVLVVTSVLAAEGYTTVREGRAQITLPEGATVKEIITKIAVEGLNGSPRFAKSALPLISKVYNKGYSDTGNAAQMMSKICKVHNLTWEPSTLDVYATVGVTDREAIVIYPWMIKNTPEKTSQEVRRLKEDLAAPKEVGLRFITTMNPLLIAGCLVKLEGTFNSDGIYKMEKVSHNGNFEGDEWDTEVQAVEIE